jgi:hypothetical protein
MLVGNIASGGTWVISLIWQLITCYCFLFFMEQLVLLWLLFCAIVFRCILCIIVCGFRKLMVVHVLVSGCMALSNNTIIIII